ncbi:MAG: hypothetical protein K5685_08295 [Bacteroidales bacterium]|nr:hypothetical protein [Bacteroidales bacterium]
MKIEAKFRCLVDFGKRYPNPMGGYGGGYLTWLFYPQNLKSYGENRWLS